jgi:hypothetical protein
MRPTKKTTELPQSAYEQGLSHLRGGKYAEAVQAFTEAVNIDPEEANAYVGRALAYRSLGNDAAAVQDEQVARALGGPVRSAWDRLVREAFRRWKGDLRDPAWGQRDAVGRNAFLLHQWTWQIYNGGVVQWVANGYGEWAEDLARASESVGTLAARQVATIVRDVAGILARRPDAREAMFQMITGDAVARDAEEDLFGALSECEERYIRAGSHPGEFVADIEAWFERRDVSPS